MTPSGATAAAVRPRGPNASASGPKASAETCLLVRALCSLRCARPSFFIKRHAAAGCGYCCCPCCCGAPEAVRAIGNHLARTGGIATCNMFPCLWTREIGNMKGDLTCEVAASGSCCYVCCPCIFISSNRDVFVQRHKLDGGCCENCASELSCSVSDGFARDGFAVCVTRRLPRLLPAGLRAAADGGARRADQAADPAQRHLRRRPARHAERRCRHGALSPPVLPPPRWRRRSAFCRKGRTEQLLYSFPPRPQVSFAASPR